jgi:hypothetical protein
VGPSIIKSKALAMMCFADKQSASSSRCVAWTLTNGSLTLQTKPHSVFVWQGLGGFGPD